MEDLEIEINVSSEAIKAVLELYRHLSLDDLDSFGFSERQCGNLRDFYIHAKDAVEEFELCNVESA